MRYLFLGIITTATFLAQAQISNFNSQRNWSRNKKEILIGFGATNFLGDLGGANQEGTDYSLKDLDFPSTGFGGVLGYRYRFHPYYATSTLLNFGMVRGSDAQTDDPVRNARNLSFRSPIINLNQRFEVIVLANEKVGRRYNIPGLKGFSNHSEQLYLFTGVGVAYFSPRTLYNGSWVALKPMKTEGQGLPGGPSEYSGITATVPFGIGFRMGISQTWRIGIEATYVKTFTDYIDDVSGVYYDPSILSAEVGPDAAAVSNPTKKPGDFFTGQQRGDKQNDALFYANLTFYKNITYKSSAYSKRIRFGRAFRAKF